MAGTLPPLEMDEFLTKMHLTKDVTTIRSLCTPQKMRFEYVDKKGMGSFCAIPPYAAFAISASPVSQTVTLATTAPAVMSD